MDQPTHCQGVNSRASKPPTLQPTLCPLWNQIQAASVRHSIPPACASSGANTVLFWR